MRPDPSPVATPDVSTPSSPQQQAPKERPKLNLTKRTVSAAVEGESASNSATDSKASPFGAARPIDTATREREVAEKRELAIRQKRETEAKEREEKAQKEAAQRAARAERADRGQAQEDDKVTSPTSESGKGARRASRQQNGSKSVPKENGETPTGAKPSFSILRRDIEGGEDEGAVEDEGEEDANGSIVANKDVKPQEVEIPKGAVEGAPQATESTAAAPEEDGWATVPAKTKNNRRGGARALAS
jgi:translation initiation factor 4B